MRHPASTALVAAALVAIFSAPRALASQSETNIDLQFSQFLKGASCNSQIAGILSRWQSRGHWSRAMADFDGGQVFQSPTQEIGAWVRVTFYPNRSAEAVRFTWNTAVTASFETQTCAPRLRIAAARSTAEETARSPAFFTDGELASIIRGGQSGIILGWSPQMPLSYQAYPEAKRLANQLHIRFVPVLDPMTDPSYARKQAKLNGIDPEALKPIRSIELLARGMNLHYPSVLVFSHGRIVDSLFPGYWDHVSILEKHVRKLIQ